MSFPRATISDLCAKIVVGHVGPSSGHRQEDGVPFLMGKNVGEGFLKLDTLERVTPEFHKAQKKSQLSPGDVVVVRIGKSGLAAKVPAALGEANCSGLVVVKGPREVTADYLVCYLNSPAGRRQSLKQAKGSTRQTLNTKSIAATQIPLPPLAEQKRIAAILDAADALRAKRRESLAQLDMLLQSTFLDMFGDPVTNPMGWEVVAFDKIGEFVSGATPSKGRKDFWNGAIPWVSPKDMKVTHLFDSQDHVSQAAFEETNLKLLEPGCVLIVVRGMILAHSFPVAVNHVPVAINQDMKGVVPFESFDLGFLLTCLRSLRRRVLAEVSTAGHGTKRFDANAMSRIMVPVPPLDLQRQFASIAESVESQKARLQAHLAELDTLFASLQSRAFRGDL